jgi:hypothetical protein
MENSLGSYRFKFICTIERQRTLSGAMVCHMPQPLYRNARNLRLSKHGSGPFCRFEIPKNVRLEGVYALTSEGAVMYIGECVSLSSRFNVGYGQISPRNCYIGGQPTNCKINRRICEAFDFGRIVELWFFCTSDRKNIERELISLFKPPWNGGARRAG